MRYFLFVLVPSLMFFPLNAANERSPEEYVEVRQQIMKYIGSSMRSLANIQRGNSEFDVEYIRSTTNAIGAMTNSYKFLFPEDSFLPSSDASEEILGSEEFITILHTLRDASFQISMVTTKEVFSEAFTQMGETCSSCHRAYRK